jgi:hypothetical protein
MLYRGEIRTCHFAINQTAKLGFSTFELEMSISNEIFSLKSMLAAFDPHNREVYVSTNHDKSVLYLASFCLLPLKSMPTSHTKL